MIPILRVYAKVPLEMHLRKVEETASGNTFIMTFVEPNYRFAQTVIIPRFASGEAVEALVEEIWGKWTEAARMIDWHPPNGG